MSGQENENELNESVSEEVEESVEQPVEESQTEADSGEVTENADEESESVEAEEQDDEQDEESESVIEIDAQAVLKENEDLRLQVDALTARLRSVSAAFQEKSKEVDETKKRLEKNNELTKSRLRGDVVSNIFGPFENLKRSLEAGEKASMDEALYSGFQMVHDEFWTALQKLGLEEIPGVGSLFNPNIHEVLTTMPVQDAVMNDTVIQVYENGYRINNTVVKTSKVIIGKYYAPPEPEEPEEVEVLEVEEGVANDVEESSVDTPSDSNAPDSEQS